jgi:hypothetical protein
LQKRRRSSGVRAASISEIERLTESPAASLEQIRRRVEIAALQQQDSNLHATARAIERKAGVIAAPPGELHQDVLASAH